VKSRVSADDNLHFCKSTTSARWASSRRAGRHKCRRLRDRSDAGNRANSGCTSEIPNRPDENPVRVIENLATVSAGTIEWGGARLRSIPPSTPRSVSLLSSDDHNVVPEFQIEPARADDEALWFKDAIILQLHVRRSAIATETESVILAA